MKIIGNSSVRRLILAAVLSIGLGFGTHVSAALGYPSYLIDLNTRTAIGLGNLSAIALNDEGQAAGISRTAAGWDSPLRAVITGPNGVGMTDLGTLGSIFNSATSINAAGQVVGYSGPSYSGRAFITGPNGVGMIGLGTLGGDWSRAYGINAAGQVVGASQTSTGLSRAFITGPNGVGMIDLGTLGGHES